MASVIRSSSAARNCSPVVFSFEDAADQADRYLEEAQAQAAAIIAEAQRQADEISRRATSWSRSRFARRHPATRSKNRSADAVAAPGIAKNNRQSRRRSPGLAPPMGTRRRQSRGQNRSPNHPPRISHHPDITVDQVHTALELAAGSPRLRISLNPDDFASLGNQIDHMSKEISPPHKSKSFPIQPSRSAAAASKPIKALSISKLKPNSNASSPN